MNSAIRKADVVGGGPLVSRACSSLAVDFGNDIWRELVLTSLLFRLGLKLTAASI